MFTSKCSVFVIMSSYVCSGIERTRVFLEKLLVLVVTESVPRTRKVELPMNMETEPMFVKKK